MRRASFTPIIATAEAIFDKEAEIYMKRLATIYCLKNGIPLTLKHFVTLEPECKSVFLDMSEGF